MRLVKKTLPALFALVLVLGGSYYLFTDYRPDLLSQVKGAKSQKVSKNYLATIPLPAGSQEVGRNERDDFTQITASCPRSVQEVQKFFRSVLVSKGWKPKTQAEDGLLSVVYSRDGEKLEVSVLSFDGDVETVFSLSHYAY